MPEAALTRAVPILAAKPDFNQPDFAGPPVGGAALRRRSGGGSRRSALATGGCRAEIKNALVFGLSAENFKSSIANVR